MPPPPDAPCSRSQTDFIAAELAKSGEMRNSDAGTDTPVTPSLFSTSVVGVWKRSSQMTSLVSEAWTCAASSVAASSELVKSFVRRNAPSSPRRPLDAELHRLDRGTLLVPQLPRRADRLGGRDQLLLALREAVEPRLQLLLGQPGLGEELARGRSRSQTRTRPTSETFVM